MMHTIAGSVFNAVKYLGVALAVLVAFAGAAHAASPGSGSSLPRVDSSSLLSALTVMIGGALMWHDTVRSR
jgi:hypothetical protein